MKFLFSILLIIFSYQSFSQKNWEDFTGEERAFYYQLSRKIENMTPQLLHLFYFTDSIPYVNDTLADFPYIEKQIVADSSKLIFYSFETARKNNGILSDLATHYAAWELDQVLQFRNSTNPKYAHLKPKLKQFEHYVLERSPQSMIKTLSNGNYELTPVIKAYYSPNLSIAEKMAAILNSGFSENDQLLVIRAIYYAQEKYINDRSREIFEGLGGKSITYLNYLLAAGDGDGWAELESIHRPKYSRALPDPRAFFKYDTEIKKDEKTERNTLATKTVNIKSFSTSTQFPTKMHVDVWGYHPERQTTIVIQKGGNSYLLYGNNDNRYVSPDSSFNEGSTYWRLIYELKDIHIADLNEKLYGKKGYTYWIEEYEDRIQKTLKEIKKTEIKLDELRYQPAGTPKMKKKKIKKKNLGYSDQDNQGHPTGKMSKDVKKKNQLQAELNELETQLANEKRMLKELIEEKEIAYDLLTQYQTLLDKMMKNVGHTFVEFKSDKNGNYYFDDGSTFNYLEQDFTFQPEFSEQNFDVSLLSFGEKVFDTDVSDVFVHLNVTYPLPASKYTLYKEVDFNSSTALSISDSIQVMEFFYALGHTDKKIKLNTYGGGKAAGQSTAYYRDSTFNKINTSASAEMNDLIYTYKINIDESIEMNVITYKNSMDLSTSFISQYQSAYDKLKSKYSDINEIDFYTAWIAKNKTNAWITQLQNLAKAWLVNTDYQATVIKKLNGLKNQTYFLGHSDKIKLPK